MSEPAKLHDQPMYHAGGYVLHLYCKYEHPEELQDTLFAEYCTEGKNAYSDARNLARKDGWILHKDGSCTCPKHSGKIIR